jgi:trimeric autotransporter adhesin
MTALSIQPPFPLITDIDGQPLEDGYIWIGVANLPPIGNPIAVYWDAALTIPAALPVRTRGGYPVNAGTPARLYVGSDYSILVQNKNGSTLYSAPAATEAYGGGIINASVVVYDPAGLGAVATTVQAKLRETVSVKDFGAVGDGVTNDTSAWGSWLAAAGSKYIPAGSYLVSGVVKYYGTGTFVNTTEANHSAGLYALEKITSGNANTAFGNLAGSALTTGGQNTAVGKSALETMQAGNNNTAVGFAALRYANDATCIQNTIVGAFCGEQLTTGNNNTAVGHNTLFTLQTGNFNSAFGQGALAYNVSGNLNCGYGYHSLLNYTGSNGCAYGVESLQALTSGINNTAVGYQALSAVTTAQSNTALGFGAGKVTTAAQGTFVGDSAGFATTTGAANTALGYNALVANQTGANNTAIGAQTLISNVSGSRNVSLGRVTLINATGSDNTAIGTTALNACTSGQYNSALGGQALMNLTTFDNCTGVGFNSQVTGSNQVQLGDSSTTTYAYGAVQDRSDARDKSDVRDTVLGLDFINALRPVDFKWDLREDYDWQEKDGSKKRYRFHHGLIAQEVRDVCDAVGVEFGGFQDHSIKGGKDVLSIGYAELIGPLIKAVQQLSARVAELEAK